MTRQETAIQFFDEYNQQDPHHLTWEGKDYPAEYFYALQLYNWVRRLAPAASEALLLASRSQHIGRWKIPRDEYPMNKAGYLNWRSDLAKFHAATAADLMRKAGYEEELINAVQQIILKQQIKINPDAQAIENALCLVFLEFQFDDFIEKHDEEKVIRIVQKSWKKMSDPGRNAALSLIYSDKGKALIERTLK